MLDGWDTSRLRLHMKTHRVLLADDHLAVLECVRDLLRSAFEVVGTVCNGQEMISEALRLNPDVIVADVGMPGLSGIEAALQLREQGSTAKVVFLTIHSEPEFVKACLDAGALGYVVKVRLQLDLIPAIDAALLGRHFISLRANSH